MIDVVRDDEGVRIALEEIFEEDFVCARIDREAEGASAETRARMESRIPPRTLSPGYYEFGFHLLRLEDAHKAGIVFSAADLTAYEVAGLVTLRAARAVFESQHPACPGCGVRQQNRFSVACHNCSTKFRTKGK